MAERTIVDSVTPSQGKPDNLAALEAALDQLRARFPGAIFERYLDRIPRVGEGVHIAPGAAIIGDVDIAREASIWFGCVLRGDVCHIRIGQRTNIQDGTVIHLGDNDPTIIGDDVVVGHRAVVHGCTVEDGCMIGIQATVLNAAVIGHGSVVGAGAVVTGGTVIPLTIGQDND